MHKRPVLVIAQQEDQGSYLQLLHGSERVAAYPLHEMEISSSNLDYDLVVLDSAEDPATGLCLLRMIKQARPDLPVIFITARSSEETAIEAFRAGARDYFSRPSACVEVGRAVERILAIRRATTGKRVPLALMNADTAAGMFQLNGDIPERLLRAIQFIEMNLPNQLSLDKIAREACLSKYHFCRQFKKHVGVSPMQFMVNLRVYRATVLLRCTDLNVATVAIRSGFSDLADFYKQFKKLHGTTPSALRRTFAADPKKSN